MKSALFPMFVLMDSVILFNEVFLSFIFIVSILISLIFFIVALNVDHFSASPEYTTHSEYLLQDEACLMLWAAIIFALKQLSLIDLLSIITKFSR